MTDRKQYCWSKDAEANDMIDMGSDHRCVIAKFDIPQKKRKRQLVATRRPQSKLKENHAKMNMS